jgi:hypothetical protein
MSEDTKKQRRRRDWHDATLQEVVIAVLEQTDTISSSRLCDEDRDLKVLKRLQRILNQYDPSCRK